MYSNLFYQRLCCILAILCFGYTFSAAQIVLKKKDMKAFTEMKTHKFTDQLPDVITQVDRLLLKYPTFIDGHLLKSEVHYRLGQLDQAILAMETALEIQDPDEPENLFTIAKIYQESRNWEKATMAYQQYLATGHKNKRMKARAARALDQIEFVSNGMSNPVDIQPIKLGQAINTEANSEYWPAFSIDGKTMIFTRGIAGQEDFYLSTKDESGEWQSARPLEEINTALNEGAHAVSADKRLIVFTGCNRRDGMGSCDLYFTYLTDQGWQKPRNIGIPINTAGWEGQPSLTADGRGLYFSSSRPGGFGGRDLWYSRLDAKGQWSQPINLGPKINTAKNEGAPHLHFDGQHLYFMSEGHPGFGEGDIFLAKKELDQWQKPVNLGYPINTEDEEGALSLSPDGKTAYYARGEKVRSRGASYHKHDIYQFEVPVQLRPNPVLTMKIKVIDRLTKELINARIELFVPGEKEMRSTYFTRNNRSLPLVALNSGQTYGVHVSAPGYLFHSDQIAVDKQIETGELVISLDPIADPENQSEELHPVVLENVFFETGSAELSPRSHLELDRLVFFLKRNDQVSIEIGGHTDDVGEYEDNQELSDARAQSVRQYLIRAGIASDRIEAKGYGETQPISSNENEAGRKLNRRTEFRIIE